MVIESWGLLFYVTNFCNSIYRPLRRTLVQQQLYSSGISGSAIIMLIFVYVSWKTSGGLKNENIYKYDNANIFFATLFFIFLHKQG